MTSQSEDAATWARDEIERLRSGLVEAASHLLDAANALEDAGRGPGAMQVRLMARHAMRVAGRG